MISIICMCQNKRLYNTYLATSLKKQKNCAYEFLIIEQVDKHYHSAIETLQVTIKKAKGNICLFVHQDVAFEDDFALSKIEEYYLQNPTVGLISFAGVKDQKIYGNTKTGLPPTLMTNQPLNQPMEVDGIDESIFAVKTDTLKMYPFSNLVCDSWQLYGIEYVCYLKMNKKACVVLPIESYHASFEDVLSESYFSTLRKIAKKYHHQLRTIDTLHYRWPTQSLFLEMKIYRVKKKKVKSSL